jgi:microcystin degradation protein MlrC
MARIAVGGFQHETNTFAPLKATWADFQRADAWPPFVRGQQLIDAVEGFNIPIAGAVKALEALGHEPLPLCWCSAPPSSYVECEAYEKVVGWIVEDVQAQGPPDAEMVRYASAMVGYRTYPHIDMAETGARAAGLLDRTLEGAQTAL